MTRSIRKEERQPSVLQSAARARRIAALGGEARYLGQRIKPYVPRAIRWSIRAGALRVLQLIYRGDAVECPACGRPSRAFPRGRCPGCGSASRQRLLVLYLRERTRIFSEPTRILHFAPEPSLLKLLRSVQTLEYVPADIDPAPGVTYVDITNIHLPAPFDGVIASHVLEHVAEDRRAIGEIFRVLRPGGWAALIVPLFEQPHEDLTITTPRGRYRAFGQTDHVRKYGREFADRLCGVGFEVSVESYGLEVGEEAAASFGLRGDDVIHFCVNPS